MSTDDLIASLCAAGRVDSHGSFSLDPAKAREKLRTFQIAEPHRYVLHLVALAVLRGATRIEFEIDTDDLWARFDGAPLAAEDFEDLYSSSFSAAQTDAERARQQLAVGLNAALALNPRFVRVTSGPPGARVRLEVRHGADDAIGRVDGEGAGTEVHVKQRFRPGLIVRFVRHVRGAMPEVTCIRERCAYAPIPIRVNLDTIRGGIEDLDPGLQFVRALRDEAGRVCVAGLAPWPAQNPEVRLVRHGVWISTLRPAHLPMGALAVVRDDGLQTDLSGQEVVQGEGRDRCLELVERAVEAATVDLIGQLAEEGLDPWARERLRAAWRCWKRAHDPSTPIGCAIAGLPWFTDIFGRPVSLAALRHSRDRKGAVFYTTAQFADRMEDFPDVVVALPPQPSGDPCEDLLLLRDLFGDRLRDRTRDLEHAVRRAARRRLWRARPAVPVLEESRYSARAPLRIVADGRTIEGQVGLRREPAGPSMLRVIVDGHLLCELEVELPLAVDAALAGLGADLELEGPSRDGAFALAALAVLDGALWLVEEDMSRRAAHELDPGQRVLARRYLELRHHPDGPRRWLRAFGIRDKAAEFALAGAQAAALPRIDRARDGAPLAQLSEPWLSECERLPTLCGNTLSLGALALALARGDRVMWTEAVTPPMTALDRIVLRLDDDTRALALAAFGDRLHELTPDELEALIEEQRFLARPVEQAALPFGACDAEVRIEDGPLRAVLGVMLRGGDEPLQAEARVIVRGRWIETRAIWAPIPDLVAALSDDRLRPAPDYRGILADAAWEAAERSLLRALPRLVTEALRHTPGRIIGDVLAASFPSAAMRGAWEQLVAIEGQSAGEASYELLLGLSSQVPQAALDAALRAALRQPPRLVGNRRLHAITNLTKIADEVGGRIDVARSRLIAGILREIRSACGQHHPGRPLSQQVAAGDRHLFAEVKLRRVDGSQASLAELSDARAHRRTIAVARVGDVLAPSSPRAVVVTRAEEDLLVRLFGEGALESPREETRLPRSPTAVRPPGDALATVEVSGSDVVGTLWLPAGVEDEACRVGLHDERGEPLRKMSLLPPLPVAGALFGPGVRPDGFKVEMSVDGRQAVYDAASRLYSALLRRDDPAARLALERVATRIGDRLLPPPLESIRQQVRERVRAAEPDLRGPPTGARSVLSTIFAELEAAAQSQPVVPESLPSPAPSAVEGTPAPPPTPESRLLEAIRTELRGLREGHERLLSGFNLDHVRLAALGPRAEPVTIGVEAVVLNGSHPLIRHAAAAFSRDPLWVDVLASLVFTALNVWRQEITDEDEQLFHRLHLGRVTRRHLR